MQPASLFAVATSLLIVSAVTPPPTGNYIERLASYADFSVDPCDDFYAFSCGGFDKTHSKAGTFSTFYVPYEKNKKFLFDYFNNLKETDQIDRSLKQVYDACMQENKDSSEKALAPILKLIDSNDFSTVQGRTVIMTELFKHSSFSIMRLEIYRAFDREDQLHDWTLVQPSLGLRYKELYTDAKIATLTESYTKLVKEVPSLSIKPEDVRALVDFESQIAKITSSLFDISNRARNSKRLSYDDLQKLMPDFVDWKTLFANITNGKAPDSVVAYNEPYFQKLSELLRKTDSNIVKQFLKVSFVEKFAVFLHIKAFQKKPEKKEDQCAQLANAVFPVMVAHKYLPTHLPPQKKQKVVDIVNIVRKSYEKLLASTPWVQQSTRTAALEKFQALDSSRIAYPDFYLDANQVMKYYEGLKLTNNIAEIGFQNANYRFTKTASQVGKNEDPNDWGEMENILNVNGFYVSFANLLRHKERTELKSFYPLVVPFKSNTHHDRPCEFTFL
jgi:predicted metalloendopeptidase